MSKLIDLLGEALDYFDQAGDVLREIQDKLGKPNDLIDRALRNAKYGADDVRELRDITDVAAEEASDRG